MVRAIIAWSLHNRLIVILGVLGLIGLGSYSAQHLNVEAYPDPTPPLIEVIAQNPGASPEEMERLVAIPLETVLNGMPGLEDLRSISIAGLTDIKCQFKYGTDYWSSRQEVLNRIRSVDNIPPGVKPVLSPWSPTGEVVRYVLEGPGYSLNQLKAVQDWVLNRAFKQVPGVVDVTGFGGTVKQYQVLVDTQKLREYNITFDMVSAAIDRSNANIGANNLMLGSQVHTVRAIGLLGEGIDPLDPAEVDHAFLIEARKIDDINNVVITSRLGTPIHVRQVAKAIIGYQPRLGVVGRGPEDDVVEGIVLMRKYEKSLPTAEAVQKKIDELNNGEILPKGMRIVPFNRRTDLVHVTTHNVVHNLVVGMGLVVLILVMFLGNLASAGIVATVIPLALLFSVSVLYFQGKSANLLSIGAVDFGIIVDSSVIIVENIFRHISHKEDRHRPMVDRIADASHEVERPLFFSTLIIVCAFLPLFAMTGPEGALFGPMANTYAFAILGTLLIALTFAPVMCSFLFNSEMEEKETIIDRVIKWVYSHVLELVLKNRLIFLSLVGLLIAWTLSLVPRLGAEFMPVLEEGNLWIRATMPRTVSLQEAARMAPKLREVMAETPEVRGVMSHVGRPDDGTDVTSFFNLEFNVPLKPMEHWRKVPTSLKIGPWSIPTGSRTLTREEIQDEMMEKFKDFKGLDFNFSQLIRDNVEEALSGVKGANSVKIFGNDLQKLEQVGRTAVDQLNTVRGIENVGLFHVVGAPNLEIKIKREECARYGINVADVEAVIQVAVGGQAFSQMVEGEKLYDIVLRLPEALRNDPYVIARIPIDVPTKDGVAGARLPLSELAEIDAHKPGAAYIYRENNRRYVPIKFGVRGRDLASTIAEAQQRIKESKVLPEGYSIEWSGEFAQMEEANARLLWMVPLSILLIMILLYTAFGSLKDALLVMANVVTATMGGIWALLLTHTTFSISAAVGFVSIFGVAVQNGVLMISYFNQMRQDGATVHDAVKRGALLRLRPVMMTSLTAILGLLPAATATSIGSQAQRPLAIVVVGGMLLSLLLTMYLMPVLYSFFPGKDLQEAHK